MTRGTGKRFDIRDGVPLDFVAIEQLYAAAFPEEHLGPLVRTLLCETAGVLTLVAIAGGALIGHAAFTACRVTGAGNRVALLGPLAVDPARQRQGVGVALVRVGLERLRRDGFNRVFVLGDPVYYGRFGFAAEAAVAPPFVLPAAWRDAWQSLALREAAAPLNGALIVPPAWNKPALWAP